jgi:hypothetical protein
MWLAGCVETVRGIVRVLAGTEDEGYIPQSAMPRPRIAVPPKPVIVAPAIAVAQDRLLVRRTLYQMTQTNLTKYLAQNRAVTPEEIRKLSEVDALLCQAEDALGFRATVSSGRRCPALNAADGGAKTSQHLRCEAVDFVEQGAADEASAVEDVFQKIWRLARAGKIRFGQLIVESAHRSYGMVYWVHMSLGAPYRDPARCGQVLRMKGGQYTLIGKV